MDKLIIQAIEDFANTHAYHKIGVAVSGGSDSIALLYALFLVHKKNHINLAVVTVNHNVRGVEESKNDAQFVQDFCNTLNIECFTYTALENEVKNLAKKRNRGVEDAARFLRYQFFDQFMSDSKSEILCMAHNRDDQLETLLLRFFQGEASSGIPMTRSYIFRPLLEVSKLEIIDFLKHHNLSFVTDSSNAENKFLRNKMRNILIPVLNKFFCGWDTAILNGAKKNHYLTEAITMLANEIPLKKMGNQIKIEQKLFFEKPTAVRVKVLKQALKILEYPDRVSFAVFESVSNSTVKVQCKNLFFENRGESLTIVYEKQNESFKKNYIIEENQLIDFGDFCIDIKMTKKKFDNDALILPKVKFPFIVRCAKSEDFICCSDGKSKKIKKIFSDWKVNCYEMKNIPIIEYAGEVQAILGEFYEKPNWIVKNDMSDLPCVCVKIQEKS
ncbi:MAG: tRNA lysidine(34) synthetase TilS [Treponemataceae bacterium]